ncbi:hypothetical protein F4820DRAFT_409571 [Hypoxylon rubiginosum]|uniref:Uncharacterized protein n=1 Tax=Hypoxylon rubiginosum TaxID=110542 RepID=A0ACB9ZCK8_9PEZI|nr:hypothetical protein F4820DRAFT_409571 [Hypoxylon rubiginosum]
MYPGNWEHYYDNDDDQYSDPESLQQPTYRYSSPQARPLTPEVRSRIGSDVPRSLVPGSGYGITGNRRRTGQEDRLRLGARRPSDPNPSSNSQPTSTLQFVDLGPNEATVVSSTSLEGEDYVSWNSYRTLDLTSMTAQATSDQTDLTRPATPARRYSDEVNEIGDLARGYVPTSDSSRILESSHYSRTPTLVGGRSSLTNEVGYIDSGNRSTFTPSPVSSYQVSDWGDDDTLDRPTYSPSIVSIYSVSDLSDSDREYQSRFTLPPTSRRGSSY